MSSVDGKSAASHTGMTVGDYILKVLHYYLKGILPFNAIYTDRVDINEQELEGNIRLGKRFRA